LKNKKTASQVVAKFEAFRTNLCNPKNLKIQVIADITKVEHPKKAWENFLPQDFKGKDYVAQANVQYSKEIINPEFKKGGTGVIAGVGSIETSFLSQNIPLDIPYGHEDEAAILVTLEYLTALEGIFWKKIRGAGLSYSFGMSSRLESGAIDFTLQKSAQIVQAYEASSIIIEDLLSDKVPIDDFSLEGAKSSTLFSILQKEGNYETAALQSLVKYLKKIGPNGNKEILSKIQEVKKEDILRISKKYLKSLFDPKSSSLVITTNPSKVAEVVQGFEKFDRKLKSVKIDDYFN